MEFVDYREVIDSRDSVARSGIEGLNAPQSCSLHYLRCSPRNDLSAKELIDLAEEARKTGEWTIFAFEGVGSGSRSVDCTAHHGLLDWLVGARDELWIEPLSNVAKRIATLRASQFRLV